MINLLPPEEKKQLFLKKRKRLIIILGVTMVVPLLCFILMLCSVEFYILGEINTQKANLQQAKKTYQTPDFLRFKDIIQKNNAAIIQLNSFYAKEMSMSTSLETISDIARPSNLYLTDVSLLKDESGNISVTMHGFSKSRDALLVFQKTIQQDTAIQNLSIAPESWVDSQNVKFSLTFEISK